MDGRRPRQPRRALRARQRECAAGSAPARCAHVPQPARRAAAAPRVAAGYGDRRLRRRTAATTAATTRARSTAAGRRPRRPAAGGPPQATRAGAGPAPDWRRRIKIGSLTLVVVLLAVSIGTYFWADSKLRREVDLTKVIERPRAGDGTNYLIVGSDSREGMSAEEKKKLHTGSAEGKRTDSMMILHVGSSGEHPDLAAARLGRRDPVLHRLRVRQAVPGAGPPDQAQRGVRAGRPRAAGPHGRAQHRPAHRPLRGDRLRRLREHRGRARRRGDEHPAGHQGQELRRRLQGGQADAERRAVPGLRPDPLRLRRAATWTARRTSRSSWRPWPARRRRRRRSSTRSSSTRRWARAWTRWSWTRT